MKAELETSVKETSVKNWQRDSDLTFSRAGDATVLPGRVDAVGSQERVNGLIDPWKLAANLLSLVPINHLVTPSAV